MPLIRQVIPEYGHGLLASLPLGDFEDCVVIAAPEGWELVKGWFPKKPKGVEIPRSMERKEIEAQIKAMPKAKVVFGIGGGSACDAAKLYGARRKARVILLPTILSVDAPFTKAVGVRENHRVRYVAEVYPERLLIDFDVLKKSPKRLHRAGVGDILSIATALFDWSLAVQIGAERPNNRIAAESSQLLYQLLDLAPDLAKLNEAALWGLADLYVGEVALCEQFGGSRPEEGSEHYFAYALESLTHRSYLHGELVVLSILVTMLHQDRAREVKELVKILRQMKVEFHPKKVGVTEAEIERTLIELPRYLEEETQLPVGIYHVLPPTPKSAKAVVRRLMKEIGAK